MRVLFGGSFNPPTIAHKKIIEALSEHFNEVIIVPNGDNYGRKQLDNYFHRKNMLKLMLNEFNNVIISDIEKNRTFVGTYQTLRDLGHPVFACGDDWIKTLHTWKNSDILLEENKFLIFTRELDKNEILRYISNDKNLSKYIDKFSILEIDFPNVSSNNFRTNHDYSVLTNEVINYIKENNLYTED